MKVLAAPEVNVKAGALSAKAKEALQSIISYFETSSMDEVFKSSDVMKITSEIFVIKRGELKVFFNSTLTGSERCVFILDLVDNGPAVNTSAFFATKDPRRDTSLNPSRNSAINPRYNSSLNPRYNSAINPRYNSAINPRYNSAINPRYNSAINPRYNSAINPRYNKTYGGPFLYSVDMAQEGYLVKANESVVIVFDLKGDQLGYAASGPNDILFFYTVDGEWTGYAVSSGQEPMLRFNTDGEWIGIIV